MCAWLGHCLAYLNSKSKSNRELSDQAGLPIAIQFSDNCEYEISIL